MPLLTKLSQLLTRVLLVGTTLLIVGIAAAPASVSAQAGRQPATLRPLPIPSLQCRLALDPSCSDLTAIIDKIIDWMTAIASLIFVAMFFIAGIQYLTSGGDSGATTKAKGSMLGAIIGLIVTIAAYAAVTTFIRAIG